MTQSLAGHLPSVPSAIADSLEAEYAGLESRYARADWRPAELNGGRFAEAAFRYMEWKSTGNFTAVGTQIRNRDATLNRISQDASLSDGIRFHVRRCTDILFDIRNKRDVAHLGTDVDVQEMDAQLVMRLAAWTLSEILREESGMAPAQVQQIIDRLSATHLPLIEEVGGDLIVVATNLTARDRALVALYHAFPDAVFISDLRRTVRYDNATHFRGRVLSPPLDDALIHIKDDEVYLTRKGAAWVEANIDLELRID